MKRFILTKYHPCVQLAHLYEHLFIDMVSERLYKQKRYKLLDYAINGTTYRSGVIIISAEAYTESTRQFFKQLVTMKTDLDKEQPGYLPIARALSQLIAEESDALFIGDTETIISELKKIDDSPWQNLDDVYQLPPRPIKHKQSQVNNLIYAIDQPAKPPHKITLQFVYKNYNTESLPLWHQFMNFLSLSIGQRICHDFCAYFSRKTVKLRGESAILNCTFLLNSQSQAGKIAEDFLYTAKKTLPELTTDDVKKRFATYLQTASYSNNPSAAPNEDQILRDIGVAIGRVGWQKIATVKNLELILEKLHIQCNRGMTRL